MIAYAAGGALAVGALVTGYAMGHGGSTRRDKAVATAGLVLVLVGTVGSAATVGGLL